MFKLQKIEEIKNLWIKMAGLIIELGRYIFTHQSKVPTYIDIKNKPTGLLCILTSQIPVEERLHRT